jgi:branched-chain amino acid transport system ATP-binding protein
MPAAQIAEMGLIHCPERRRPFKEMTVLENLQAGGYMTTDKKEIEENLQPRLHPFPILKERSHQYSGTLSGGEQQMLAIGRALMSKPKLLCIDEPSTGLAPIMRAEVFRKIKEIKDMGITVLLVEQEVSTVFKMTERNYVLSSGKIIAEGRARSCSRMRCCAKPIWGCKRSLPASTVEKIDAAQTLCGVFLGILRAGG